MAQHELLMALAAPLLVLGRPTVAFLWAIPMSWRRILGTWSATPPVRGGWELLTLPLVAWALQAAGIWLWHAPALFQATLASEWVHTLQHVSFLGSAVHTMLLGALLTFSNRVWYPIYNWSTAPWGLSPLEDQQLAGLIMWVPAGLAYLIAALAIAGSWLGEGVERTGKLGRSILSS